MRSRLGIAAIIAAAASGCAGGLHADAPTPQAYVLRAPPPPPAVARSEQAASLRVMRPYAAPGLDTDSILLLESDRRLSHYASSRWAAPLPDVVESLAVDTVRASSAWSAVEDSHSSFVADYYLQITIRRFEADTTGGAAAPVVRVSLVCMLGRGADHELIAAFPAEGSAAAAENRLGAVVAAFEQAADAALAAASEGAASALRTSRNPSPPAADKTNN